MARAACPVFLTIYLFNNFLPGGEGAVPPGAIFFGGLSQLNCLNLDFFDFPDWLDFNQVHP